MKYYAKSKKPSAETQTSRVTHVESKKRNEFIEVKYSSGYQRLRKEMERGGLGKADRY